MSIRRRLGYALLDRALEHNLLADPLLRVGSRWGAAARLRHEERGGLEAQGERFEQLVASMRSGPIAELPAKANQQHYELPAEFFELFLGPRLKYSASYWPEGVEDLAAAEEAMLALVCERAGIEDGMSVLDLGCGWGSLSLWIAERYPNARVLAVSNSAVQRAWIETQHVRRGLGQLEVITADVNDLALSQRFDRVVSIEMFEHMRNWQLLLARIAGWLEPNGRAFRPRLLAPASGLHVRGHVGGGALLHRRAHAIARADPALPARSRSARELGGLGNALRPHARGLAGGARSELRARP
jgi:cyclopropane-fatty-acyl-phospholipid synthase